MRVIFLGPPGSGKGTQAELLCQRRGLSYLGTGELLRAAIRDGTPLGLRARTAVDAGLLVPDELIHDIIAHRLAELGNPSHYVIDGDPRTLAQALTLDHMLGSLGLAVTDVVLLRVPDEELVGRMLARHRGDDTEEVIRARLAVYHHEIGPIAEHYRAQGKLREVEAVGGVEEVYNALVKQLHP